MLGKISERNFEVKDKKVREMIMKLPMIKPNIKIAALSEYLKKCISLQRIAFGQWREMYPSARRDGSYELEEMIMRDINWTYCNSFDTHEDEEDKPFQMTDDQFSNFKNEIYEGNGLYNIVSFKQIGMLDPFPLESSEH